MRVLAACSLGGAGHLRPLLPFLAAAERRGGETLVVGPPALAEMVAGAGLRFWAGGEPPEEAVAPIREQLPVVPAEEASRLGNRELFGRLAARAMLAGMEEACIRWRPDLVLRDPCEYASAAVGTRLGLPVAQVAISLADAEAGSIRVAAPALEELQTGLTEVLLRSPYATAFPASLDPSPFARTLRFHDPPAPGRSHPRSGEQWWGDVERPRVYVTFGTVLGHMTIAGDVYRAALGAVAGLDVSVVLTVGNTFDPSELGEVPPNVRVERWIDQAAVLESADLVVCHGGSGTALGALAAGVPLVVVPSFADQFENARRLVAQGAAVVVETEPDPGAFGRRVVGQAEIPRIARAVERVLSTASFRREARRLGAEMAAGPTVDDVLDLLDGPIGQGP